jgi:hypothetical protein
MKHLCCLIVLAVVASICMSQTHKRSDLKKFSSDQLKACYSDKTVCGTDDVYAISDELQRRLPKLPSEQLTACLADWKVCGVGNDSTSGWAVSDEIARRGNPDVLFRRYWTERNPDVRYGIIHVADHFKSKEAFAFMQKVLAEGWGDDDTLYWPASYLAERCDPAGLKWLSTREGRPEGCIIFTGTVRVFGKCQYRPAIPYLVNYSLDDACLNIVDDAEVSLEKLYPDHPANFSSLEAMQMYYCTRAFKEGFHVDCPAK